MLLFYLIAIGKHPFPLPYPDLKTTHSFMDGQGNWISFPAISGVGLYPTMAVLVTNLFQYWRQHHLKATTEDGSTTVLVEENITRSLILIFYSQITVSKEQCPHVHHAASKHFDAASGCLCSSFAPASSDLAPTPCLSSISTSSSSCQVLQLNDSCRRCSFYGICFI